MVRALVGALVGATLYAVVAAPAWLLLREDAMRAQSPRITSAPTKRPDQYQGKVDPSSPVKYGPTKDRSESPVGRPIRVTISAIDVDAPVRALGLRRDRTLETPQSFSVTGWYEGSAVPGRPGPAIIVGHLDSYTGPAVFANLEELHPGDHVLVTDRWGSAVKFTVTRSSWYTRSSFPTQEVYGDTLNPTLRLITCGGDFDETTGHYLHNYVVYAVK